MSEWKPFDTAPKDGTCFLATDGKEIYSVRWKECLGEWIDLSAEVIYFVLTYWMEAPELPVKEHNCQMGDLVCTTFCSQFYVYKKVGSIEEFKIPCAYCPFCGEKA